MLAAALTGAVTFMLAKGGADERLMRRASRSLELATRDLPRATRARLRESAADDVAKALRLRQTKRGFHYLLWSTVGSAAVVVVIPWYVQTEAVSGSPWQQAFWLIMWGTYFVMTIALAIALATTTVRRSRSGTAR